MPVSVSVHLPLLFRMSGLSMSEPTQTLPKSPVSARIRVSLGAGALPETATMSGPAGSSLRIRIVPDLAPKLIGRNRIIKSIDPPAPTFSG